MKLLELQKELESFETQLIRELKPEVIEGDELVNASLWFTANDTSVETFNQGEKFIIATNKKEKTYLSFKEKNNSFKILPQQEIRIYPEERISVDFRVKTYGDISVYLIAIEYDESKKLGTEVVRPNQLKRFITSKNSRNLRIALKISGEGFIVVERMRITRNLDFDASSFSRMDLFQHHTPRHVSKPLKEYKVACIFDEFSMTCFKEQVKLIPFTKDNWKEVLTQTPPDVLIVESAWKGNFGSWEYMIGKYNNQDQSELIALVEWCKKRGIPTAFWNKEDPIHFEKFIHSAQLFDHVFTTDQNMISEYVKVLGRPTVYALPFSAEPKLHNPIQLKENRIDKICFAGSYYANRHEDRKRDMEKVLDIAAEFGLDIYDRNYTLNQKKEGDFSFPERFQQSIKGSLKYDEIAKANKGYKVMLNVNSVKNSPTMFSRRVFEGLASGTPILSSYSEGIKRIFKDIVMISEDEETLRQHLKSVFNDETFYRSKSMEGIREVHLNHTYKHRLTYMLEKFGFDLEEEEKTVAVISVVRSKEEAYQVINLFRKQSYENKKLILLLDLFDGYIDILNQFNNVNVTAYVLSYMDHYDRIEHLVDSDYVSYFSPNHFYGENYLLDLLIATEYSQAEIIGKANHFVGDEGEIHEVGQGAEYVYVSDLNIHNSLLHRRVFKGVELVKVISDFQNNISLYSYFKQGYRLFSSDKFNFVKNPSSNSTEKIENTIEI
ncbi:glycosyltransferase [Bacillus sp. FSL R5-0432]|uniref:CgeB family protein n=1 Tax=unclassified Bacillus (in: firmicutes) TaxID=185979 RepID=UPI00057C8DF4|nr:glycosyltransferase [Bacillus sp. WP8]AIZ61714.1 hypothetical protein QR42_16205 [Bacillus sp. WP8]